MSEDESLKNFKDALLKTSGREATDLEIYVFGKTNGMLLAEKEYQRRNGEPVAYVPVHPKEGPLWASTIKSLDSDRPNYPVLELFFAPQPLPSGKFRAALLWLLWHHQGGSSEVGQPIRKMLGIGQHEHMTEEQVAEAKGHKPLLLPTVEEIADIIYCAIPEEDEFDEEDSFHTNLSDWSTEVAIDVLELLKGKP